MANTYLKMYSASSDIRKMQIKIALKLLSFNPDRMAIKKTKDKKCGKDVEKKEPLYFSGGNVKQCGHMEICTAIPQKLQYNFCMIQFKPTYHRNNDVQVHCCTIYNSPTQNQTRCP